MARLLRSSTLLLSLAVACGSPPGESQTQYPPGTLLLLVDSTASLPGELYGVRLPNPQPFSFPSRGFFYSDVKALTTPGDVQVQRIDLGRFNVLTGAGELLWVDQGTVQWAVPSPDEQSILMQQTDGRRRLLLLNRDGSIRRELLPAPAPDGRYASWLDNDIAFLSYTDTTPPFAERYYRLDTRDGALSPTELVNVRATASPDGTRLAMLVDAAGSDRQVELRVLSLASGESVLIATMPRLAYVPVWSPDGEWLATTRLDEAGFLVDVFEIKTGRRLEVGDRSITSIAVSWAHW